MKILHALVGYLAVTALPFHQGPFAFAYPLAVIDYYDGYVNTTQIPIDGALMKHVLGSIVATCQTVTTQNHGDSAIMKRVLDDIIIIEARQATIPVVGFILFVVADVIFTIGWISTDDAVRGSDVEFPVEHFD